MADYKWKHFKRNIALLQASDMDKNVYALEIEITEGSPTRFSK